ncbi:MAG: DUF4846 domain-containing protein [Eubacterium sp.]|nr:DUF4846 domain-containing protein [Eubacterium sp.]
MTERNAIQIAAVLGAVVLVLMIIVLEPFSRFEEEYPLAASGSAVSGTVAKTGGVGQVSDSEVSGKTADVTPAAAASGAAVTSDSVTGIPLVHATGGTLETRVSTPDGFTRTQEAENSLGTFLRTFKLKKDGYQVHLYNKELKSDQNAHVAVFKLPLEKEDLQQCADSVMRVYAEYFRATGQNARIKFSLTDNFVAEYQKWREGYRIIESGDGYEWEDRAEFDASDTGFKKFMRIVFAYSGTYSLVSDSKKVKLNKLRIGDIFIHAGSPGHVVMVVDTCENAEGRKAFLLAQGYMPAQQFHLLKNPAHADDPWYYVDEVTYPFQTPEYTFEKECLRRPKY